MYSFLLSATSSEAPCLRFGKALQSYNQFLNYQNFLKLFLNFFLGGAFSAPLRFKPLLPESECKGRAFFRFHQIFSQLFFKKYAVKHIPATAFSTQRNITQPVITISTQQLFFTKKRQAKANRPRQVATGPHSRRRESMTIVTGPSFISDIFMSAKKIPLRTGRSR